VLNYPLRQYTAEKLAELTCEDILSLRNLLNNHVRVLIKNNIIEQ